MALRGRQSASLSRVLLSAASTALIAACSGDDIQAPKVPVEGTLTVDAATTWGYASLTQEALVTVTDAATSDAWDIGFNATNVALNGGTAGPGGITAYCICQNAGATNEEILAMTAESEKADFDAVTATTVSATTFAAEASPAVFDTQKWYKYNLANDHRISPTFDVYLVKRGEKLYKIQVINYYGPAGETRQITFRYALLES